MHDRSIRTGRRSPALAAPAAVVAAGLLAAACSGRAAFTAGSSPSARAAPGASASARPGPGASTGPAAGPSSAGPSTVPPAGSRPLAGKTVGIDPGHNGLNQADPGFLSRQVWNGRSLEDCDTTGTQTASGYTEAEFNFSVARYLRAQLRSQGARVAMTRTSNDGLGPCVDRRARILNRSGADVAIDIHADGGPAYGRGFTVLEPVADGPNDHVIAASLRFGGDVHAAFLAGTPFHVSDYYGQDGYILRNDLAGLNLTTVPKILIECGNMTNAADAALLTSPAVQRRIARALDRAIVRFLAGR